MMSQIAAHADSQSAAARIRLVEIADGLSLPGVKMRFVRNEEIFGEGEPADHVYRLVRGAVRLIRFSSDGRRQIVAFHLPGDVFGHEEDAAHAFSAEALCDCEVELVRRAALDRAGAESAAAANALRGLARADLARAREHILMLGLKGANERVGAFLLALAERAAADRELDLPMSRADIADHLALTIETVSRAFTHMERTGAIALPSARRVLLEDRAALAERDAA